MISGRHLSGSMRLGFALHHDLGVRVNAGDANLDRHEITPPDLVLLRHLVDMADLGLDLHRAFRSARRCDGLAAQGRQSADAELVFLMPVAAPDLAGRHRVGSGGARQPVDRADKVGRRQIEHAFA